MNLASACEAIGRVEDTLTDRITSDATTLEAASRIFADEVYAALDGAVLLARVFAAVRCGDLPAVERANAERVAGQTAHVMTADSPVLALMASRGSEPSWNDRRRSRRHLALPLGPSVNAESFPMLAALLRDLGATAPIDKMGRFRSRLPIRTFYVFDARTTVDESGRLTIPDRDFVEQYDVQTVLGVGGTVADTLFAMILFARQHVTRASADRFVPLAARFASLATGAVSRKQLFDGGP